MEISKISTATLRNVLRLAEKRDALVAKIEKLEKTINSAAPSKAKPEAPAKRRGRPAKVVAAAPAKKAVVAKAAKSSGRRGAVKEQIIAALKAAGSKGVSVKDLASKLDIKAGNIHVWFATTGKTVGVAKVAPGVYRLA
jgi:hypothetical protein